MAGDPHPRLFFALWPSTEVRAGILRAFRPIRASTFGGRPVHPQHLHLTLSFLGELPQEQRACLQRQARKLRVAAFTLCLDRWGHFDRARVFWLGCKECPDALGELQNGLRQALPRCGLPAEERPFTPHVTLVRKVPRPRGNGEPIPIEWPVRSFVLAESVATPMGRVYQVVERYGLADDSRSGPESA